MKKCIYYLLSLCLILSLFACDSGMDSRGKKDSQEAYDYRNERYQDFYSRYMRKTNTDYLIVRSQAVSEKLGLGKLPDDVHGRMNVYKTDLDKTNPIINKLISRQDILAYYNRDGEQFESCDEKLQEDNFFCLVSKNNGINIYTFIPLYPMNSNKYLTLINRLHFLAVRLMMKKTVLFLIS